LGRTRASERPRLRRCEHAAGGSGLGAMCGSAMMGTHSAWAIWGDREPLAVVRS
jgi:hypothetical protein